MNRNGMTTLERAFDLARSGDCRGTSDIRQVLAQEGYPDIQGQLYGNSIRMQLTEACQSATKAKL